MPAFARTIGIDYSARETPTASLKGLRRLSGRGRWASGRNPPAAEPAQDTGHARASPNRLVERLAEDAPTLVGIDHGFSFPLRYFETHGLLLDWPTFLHDFQRHWPTDEDHTYVEFVRDGVAGDGAARVGGARRRRLTENRPAARNRSSTLTSRDRWRNPPMPAFPGYASSASASETACISGRSTAGTIFRPGGRPSPRSIPRLVVARLRQ